MFSVTSTSNNLIKNSIMNGVRCLSSSINPATTAVFICDIQNKFKYVII